MHSKSFTLKNLRDYYKSSDPNKSSDSFSLPKLPNNIQIGRLRRKESKIEINRNLSLNQIKPPVKLIPKPIAPKQSNKVGIKDNLNPPLASRLNVSNNFFFDKILMKKKEQHVSGEGRKRNIKKVGECFGQVKNERKSILNNTVEVFGKSKSINNQCMDPIHISRKNINEYFDNIIKEFGLDEVQLDGNEEINIFDLYLQNEL